MVCRYIWYLASSDVSFKCPGAVLELSDVGLGNRRGECGKTGKGLQQTLDL